MATTYLPDPFRAALKKAKAKPVDAEKLIQALAARDIPLREDQPPFLSAEMNRMLYGFALPKEVSALLDIADDIAIEDVKMKNFKYCRVAPEGWEMPTPVRTEPYLATVLKRFDWNTFSNMQLWEHLAGLMPLGWDGGDNRYEVSTVSNPAHVFWLDNETARIYGPVASSLSNFLAAHMGNEDIPKLERTLSRAPSSWTRAEDELEYLPRNVPLSSWPPFLAARSEWLIAQLCFADSKEQRKHPEISQFDLKMELKLVSKNEPLALYWLLRSFILDEQDVFDEVASQTRTFPSLLVSSTVEVCERSWKLTAKESSLVQARTKLKAEANTLRKAKWPKDLSTKDL